MDAAGHAYVAGRTHSRECTFPVAVGPDLTWNGGDDAFVAKVDAVGTVSTTPATSAARGLRGRAIAVDASGDAYVTGLPRLQRGPSR